MKTNKENTCQDAIAALLGELDKDSFTQDTLESLCSKFPDCSEELQSNYSLWKNLGEVEPPVPSPVMDAGFYKMLNEFSAEQKTNAGSWWNFDWRLWNGFDMRWVIMAGVFLLGMASGIIFLPRQQGETLANIEQKEPAYIKLTSSESTTDRLQSIQMIKELEKLDERVIDALNQVLLYDDNDNVRLSAIETMLYFSDNPMVRESLIRAIPYQNSPLIQMTLAEVMVALNDQRAIEEIKQLLQSEELELEVKMKMEETIEVLL